MESHERVKKPDPERTEPIRNWWTAFGPAGEPPPPGAPAAGPGEPPPADPVSHGVEQGYRVVGEYLRQGQNAARRFWSPFLGASPPDGDMNHRLEALARSFLDFTGLWMEVLGMPGGRGTPPREPPAGSAGPFTMGPEPAPEAAPAAPPPDTTPRAQAPGATATPPPPVLTLDVECPMRVELSVDLRPGASTQPLRVVDLRAAEPGPPPLTDVHLGSSPDGDQVTLRLRVPDGQPPGVYSGLILHEGTGLPRGTLAVRLSPR